MPQHTDGKTGSGGGRMSPVEMQKHLKGVDYPASKEDLVMQARSNHAPDNILRTIQQLHGNSFNSPKDVMKALGQSE